jgi:hypothetical protein
LHVERRRGVIVDWLRRSASTVAGEVETAPRSPLLLPPQAAAKMASPNRIGSARLTAG